MRFATSLTFVTITAATSPVWAGAALDDDKKSPTRTTDPAAAPDSLTTVGRSDKQASIAVLVVYGDALMMLVLASRDKIKYMGM